MKRDRNLYVFILGILFLLLFAVFILDGEASTDHHRDLPGQFFLEDQPWTLSVSDFQYMLFDDKPLGHVNCKIHDIQIQNGMSDEDTRVMLRVQLDHAITECETEHQAGEDNLFFQVASSYEDLVNDARNKNLRLFLEER